MQVILQKNFYLLSFSFFFFINPLHSLRPTTPSWASREADSRGERLVLTPTPTKGLWCSGGRTENSLWLPPRFLAPGGSSRARTAKHCRKWREKRNRKHEGRDRQKERKIERRLLGCYSSIQGPFLWWSHLLREGQRQRVEWRQSNPVCFQCCYWEFWSCNVQVKPLNA